METTAPTAEDTIDFFIVSIGFGSSAVQREKSHWFSPEDMRGKCKKQMDNANII
jgi:hypothetical protein